MDDVVSQEYAKEQSNDRFKTTFYNVITQIIIRMNSSNPLLHWKKQQQTTTLLPSLQNLHLPIIRIMPV